MEDNLSDVILTQRAFKKASILNQLVVARDGVEALDYLFGTGAYVGQDLDDQPILVLLDLKLPRWMVSKCCDASGPTTEPSSFPW